MNIQFQICGLIIIFVLMILYARKPILGLHTQRMFRNMFCTLFLCLCFDIFSLWAIHTWPTASNPFVVIICKIYLTTLVAVALTGFLYIYADVKKNQGNLFQTMGLYLFLAIADAAGIFIAPIYVHQNGSIAYTDGPSVLITYAGAAGFVFYNLFYTIKNRKTLNPRRRSSMIIWLSVWITAAALQFIQPQLLVVGFAGALGTMIVFVQMENPELFMDRATGFFNPGALTEYLEMQLQDNRDFAVLTVLIRYGFHKGITAKTSENILLDLAKQLRNLPRAKTFKVWDNEIQVVFQNLENAAEWAQRIPDMFQTIFQKYPEMPSAEYIFLPGSHMITSATKLAQLIQYIDSSGLLAEQQGIFPVTDALIEKVEHESLVTALIEKAIQNDDLIEVFYQPIYDTKTNSFTSAEALVRMYGQDGKLIPPGDFIPLAEANGMILQIGEIVFDKVCRFFVEKNLESLGMHYIEVNLSMIQCVQNDLADTYINTMKKHHIPSSNINLEITESASMEAKQILLKNMKTLLRYGVSFSLDDFGTGQSNLNYIMEMPVDIVKFDKGMTDAYFENERAKYIMDTTIQMIHGMGLEIVSEGVETKEMYDELAGKGIDHIQGYYFSRPLPGEEFLQFLKEHTN